MRKYRNNPVEHFAVMAVQRFPQPAEKRGGSCACDSVTGALKKLQKMSLTSAPGQFAVVVLGDSDGIHQADSGDTPGEFSHIPLLGIPPPWIEGTL